MALLKNSQHESVVTRGGSGGISGDHPLPTRPPKRGISWGISPADLTEQGLTLQGWPNIPQNASRSLLSWTRARDKPDVRFDASTLRRPQDRRLFPHTSFRLPLHLPTVRLRDQLGG